MRLRSATQPFCPYCDSPLKKWTVAVYFRKTPEEPRFGEGFSFIRYMQVEQRPKTKSECQRLTNKTVVSTKRDNDGTIRAFGEWDGESYRASLDVFCSSTCAQLFGLASYQAGYRIKRREEQVVR